MKKSILKNLALSALFIAGAGMLFNACSESVGLGESVDTKAPKVAITYPPVASIIRDQFTLAGTWEDDKGLKEISVSVLNTNTNEEFKTAAEINTDKTWTVKLNQHDDKNDAYYNGWHLADGKYQVTVVAKDNAGNSSGETSRSFDIDNTPPVFIISKPGVVKGDNKAPSAYGTIFTIEGTIADDHAVSSMEVIIYNENGEVISKENYDKEEILAFHEDEIATAGGTSVTIAQFGDTRYSTIHPASNGEEKYYCSVKLTDEAKVYDNPNNDSRTAAELKEDSTGNYTYNLWLYDDVFTSLMSAKKGLGLSAAELKNIINKTTKNDRVAGILSSSVKDTSRDVSENVSNNYLYFTLNPEANPNYQINGFQYSFNKDELPVASSGNSITVTVNQGLDQTKIDPACVKVWMKAYTVRPENEASLKDEISLLCKNVSEFEDSFIEYKADSDDYTSFDTGSAATEGKGDDWILIYDYSKHNAAGSSVDTKTFSVELPAGSVVLDRWYIVAVTGYDVEEVRFLQDQIYGFAGNEPGIAPSVSFVSPANLSKIASSEESELVFEGKLSIDSDSIYVKELSAVLTVTDEETGKDIKGKFDAVITKNSKNGSWTTSNALTISNPDEKGVCSWKFIPSKLDASEYAKIKAAKLSGKTYLYSLSATAVSSSKHEAQTLLNVHVDAKAPVVTITSLTPTVTGADYYANYTGADKEEKQKEVFINDDIYISINIEETNLLDVRYDIFAKDRTNPASEMKSVLAEMKAILADRVVNNDEKEEIEKIGTIGKAFSKTITIPTGALTELFDESGADHEIEFEVVVYAEDECGNIGQSSTKSVNDNKVHIIKQETDKPRITLGNASNDERFTSGTENISEENGNLFGTTSNNKLSLSIVDDDAIYSYKVAIYNKDGVLLDNSEIPDVIPENPYELIVGKTSTSYNYTLPSKEGVYIVEVSAIDGKYLEKVGEGTWKHKDGSGFKNFNDETIAKMNNTKSNTTGKFYIAVSKGAPSIALGNVDPYQTSKPVISGTVSNGDVKVEGVFIDSETEEVLAEQPAVITITKNGTEWSSSVNTELRDGKYKVLFTATNSWKQVGSVSATYTVDAQAPSISDISASDVYLDKTTFTTINATAQDIAISRATAVTSGIAGVYYKISKENTKPVFNQSAEGWLPMNLGSGANLYTATTDIKDIIAEDGNLYIFVAAADNAGNRIVADVTAITVDKSLPVISVAKDEAAVAAGATLQTTAASYTVEVTVKDTNADTLTSTNEKVSVGSGTAVTGGKKFSVTVGSIDDNTTETIVLNAKDENGREAQSFTFNVSRDNTAPEVIVDSFTKQYTSNSTVRFTGKASDEHLDTVKAYIYKTEIFGATTGGTALSEEGEVLVPNSTTGVWTLTKDGLEDGYYYVKIVAEDTFTNETSVSGAIVAVDTVKPASTYVVSGLYDSDGNAVAAAEDGKTYYAKAAYSFGGKVTEANFKNATIKAGNETAEPLTLNATSDWSYTPAAFADGRVVYAFTFTDKAENTSTYSYTVVYDTTEPEVKLNTPTAGYSYSNRSITLEGTAKDAGIGIASVKYTIKNITDAANPETVSDKASANVSGNDWNANQVDLGEHEGTFNIIVEVEDKFGFKTTTDAVTFYFDVAAPNLIVSGDPQRTVKGDMTLEGTATDSYGVAKVEVSRNGVIKETITEFGEGGSWTQTVPTGTLPDGTYTYSVIATDKADKKSTTSTVYVNVDKTVPVVANGVASINAYLDVSKYITLNATASDTKVNNYASGVAGVYYIVKESNTAPVFNADDSSWKVMGQTVTGYSSTFDVSEYSAADKTLYAFIAAVDKAGNSSVSDSTEITVDKSLPVITVAKDDAAVAAGATLQTTAASYTVEVTVKDTNAKELTSTNAKVSVGSGTDVTGGKKFSVTVGSIADNTTETIVLTAKDKNGREAQSFTFNVSRDNTAPDVVINEFAAQYSKSSTVRFTGTASDAHLDTVKAYIYKTEIFGATTGGTVLAEEGEVLVPNSTTGVWTLTKDGLEDGYYYVKIEAKDTFTNETVESGAIVAVDTTLPYTTLVAQNLYDHDGNAITTITNGNTYYSDGTTYTIGGVLTEKNLESALVKVNGGVRTIDLIEQHLIDADGNWSYSSETHNSDVAVQYSATIIDKAGNTYVASGTVIRDTTKPEVLTLTSPAAGYSFSGNSITLEGNAQDNGIGLKEVKYIITNITNPEAPVLVTAADGNAASFSGGTWNALNIELGNNEGSFKVDVIATDKFGNSTNVGERTFYYDKAVPVLNVSTENTIVVNGDFTLEGTATDSYGITDVEIKLDGNSSTAAYNSTTHGWTKTITPAADGIYTYSVTARDKAAKNSDASTVVVKVDTKNPDLSDINDPELVKLDVSRYITLNLNAADEEVNSYASGVSAVYYMLKENTTAPENVTKASLLDRTLWKPMSHTTDWNTTFQLADTYNADTTLYAFYAAVDNAGNIAVANDYSTITIDATLPKVTVYIDDAYANEIATTGFQTNNTNVTLYVTVTDSNVASLTGSASNSNAVTCTPVNEPAYTTGKKYKVTFTAAEDGTTDVTLKATDSNGRESNEVKSSIKCDLVKPVVTLTSPAAAGYTNSNTVNITGTVLENNLNTVTVSLVDSEGNEAASGLAKTTNHEDYTETAKKYNWSVTLANVPDGSYKVKVAALDTYTNENDNQTYAFNYVVDTVKPVIGTVSSTFSNFNIAQQNDTNDFILRASISDVTSGINEIAVYDNDVLLEEGTDVTTSNTGAVYSFNIDKGTVKDGSNTYKIVVKDNAENEQSVTKTINSDIIAPTVTIGGVSPTTTLDSVAYVNGVIKVSGTASDTSALKAELLRIRIKQGETVVYDTIDTVNPVDLTGLISATAANSYTLGSTYKTWSFNVNTAKLDDEQDYTIEVMAEDTADNPADITSVDIKVNQITDKPGITVNTVDLEKDTIESLEGAEANIFAKAGKLTGTFTDDDGLASVNVKIAKENAAEGAYVYNQNVLTKIGATSFTLDKSLSQLGITAEGGYLVTIEAQDNKEETDNSLNSTTFAIAVDDRIPAINIVSPAAGNFFKDSFGVTGSVSDASGVVTVTASGTGSSVSFATEAPVSLTSNNGTLTDTVNISDSGIAETALNETGSPEAAYEITYTAKDRWGRTNSAVVSFYKDTAAPSFVDDNSYVGNSANKTMEAVRDIWFGETALTFAGEFTDDGSGVAQVYYWLDADGTVIKEGDITKATGSMTASRKGTSTTYTYNSIISGFDENSDGHKFVFKSVDKAGNASTQSKYTIKVDQTAPTFTSEYYKYADSNIYSSASGTVLTNKRQAITIYGKITDSASGVAEFGTITVNGTSVKNDCTITYSTVEIGSTYEASNFGEWVTAYDSTFKAYSDESLADKKTAIKTWKIVIPAAKINQGDLKITPKDVAGNGSVQQVFAFNVDIVPPTVDYVIPADASKDAGVQVNGKIALSGTAKDAKQLSAVTKVQYRVWDSTAESYGVWTDMAASDFKVYDNESKAYVAASSIFAADSSAANWTTNIIDTADLFEDSLTTAVKVQFRTVVTDAAGNDSIHTYAETAGVVSETDVDGNTLEVFVDQASDRPYVKFNEISGATGTLRKYTKTITGSIGDDDGVAAFKIMATRTALTTQELEDFDWEEYDQEGTLDWTAGETSFTFEPDGDDDGSIYLYFYIRDNEGSEFTTANATSLNTPYVDYKGDKKKVNGVEVDVGNVDNDTVIEYKTDSHPPVVNARQYFAGTQDQVDAMDIDSDVIDLPSTITVGGTLKPVVKFVIEGYDVIGVDTLTGVISTTPERTIYFTKVGAVRSASEKFTGTLDVSGIDSGSYTLALTLKDISDLTANITVTVNIDNTAPTVTIRTPSTSTLLTGDVTVTGQPADTYSEISTVKYLIMKDTYETDKTTYDDDRLYELMMADAGQYNAETVNMFEFPFDGVAYNEDGDKLDNITGTAGTDYWMNPKLPATREELNAYAEFTTDSQIYNIPVYFMAEDALGNWAIKKDFYIHYNPYSDRPTTEVLYPDPSNTNNLLSGQVRLSGSAVDNVSVSAVYFQIRPDTDAFRTANARDLWGTNAKTWAEHVFGTNVKVKSDINAAANFDADLSFWGIRASGTASWYSNLNTSGVSLQISDGEWSTQIGTSGTYKIAVRAVALDNNETLGNWSVPVSFTIDPNAPSIGSSEFPKIEKKDTANETALDSRLVQGEIYLKDQWFLVTSVEHTNDISEITYTLSTIDNTGATTSDTPVTLVINSAVAGGKTLNAIKKYWDATGNETTEASAATKGYLVKIPLNTASGSGTRTVKIDAKDATGEQKSGSATYSFKYDNEAPVITNLTQNGYAFTSDVGLTNSNNQLTLGATVEDPVAGFSKALFYFYRESEGTGDNEGKKVTRRIYDPFIGEYTGDNPAENPARIDVTDANGEDITTGGITKEELGEVGHKAPLYGLTKTVTKTADNTLTFSGDSAHIRVGGIVKVADSYRVIKTKTGTDTITITFSPECNTGFTSAFFPFAQVVDNTSTEKVRQFTNEGVVFNNDSDDGDGMPESISGMTSSRTWEASIHGNWIPDGAVTFVMFAFDASENVAALTQTAIMANNRPRISKIHLGTDLDGSESFTDGEFETYNLLGVQGASQEVFELTTAGYSKVDGNQTIASTRKAFKIKDRLAVVPEFVGGNGKIYLVFNNNDTTESPDASGEIVYEPVIVADVTPLRESSTISGTKVSGKLFTISADDVGDDTDATGTGATRAMSFTFWDSTDEAVPGETTQYAFLRVKDMNVKQSDTVKPNAVIDPFFWKGLNDNSIYGSSSENTESFADLQGHIELEDDWATAVNAMTPATKTALGANLIDSDPKVSGKISIRGSAYDDFRITELYAVIDGFTFKNAANTSGIATTTVTTTENNNSVSRTMVKLAEYADGEWTPVTGGMADYGWNFTVTDGGLDQTGHRVTWQLDWDTSKIATVVGLNKTIQIAAKDKGGNYSFAAASTATVGAGANAPLDTSEEVYNKPSYRVDVVPYVLKVETRLSKQKVSNWSVYNRSARGHYPVQSVVSNVAADTLNTTDSEDVILHGFNLNGTTVAIKDRSNSDLTVRKTAQTEDDLSKLQFNVATLGSGSLTATVDGIYIINNYNNNDAMGGATSAGSANKNKYNMQGNGDTNNILNDDLVFDVWEFNDRAAVPINGLATGVQMQVNQVSKMLNFAFANGGLYYSMGGKVDNVNYSSYYWAGDWDTFAGPCVGLGVDDLGYTYSVASGGDTNSGADVDKYDLYTSRWGVGLHNTEGTLNWHANQGDNNFHAARLEEIAIKTGSEGFDYSLMKYRYLSSEFATSVRATITETEGSLMAGIETLAGQIANTNRWRLSANTTTFAGKKVILLDTNKKRLGSATLSSNTTQNTGGNKYWYYTLSNLSYTGTPAYVVDEAIAEFNTVRTSSSSTTNLYLVNYDALTDEIRFRAGAFADNTVGPKGGFVDTYKNGNASYYATENCQVIANAGSDSYFPSDGAQPTKVEAITGRGAGQYVDVAVAKNGTDNKDAVCVVWYDAYDNCLKYSYSVDPVGNWTSTHKGNRTAAGWSSPTTIFAEGGEYCQIAVDANNHIHIAAYAGNGDVKYAYLDSYNSSYTESTNSCTVDASGSVGEHLTLDVAIDANGNSIPYIGYFTAAIKAPKYAYLVDTTNTNHVPAGVDSNERFTGAWEVTVVPTPSRPTTNREDKINIGVFKTTGGVLTWSTTNGREPAVNNIGTSESSSTIAGYDSTETSKCYGNGSKNAVFAYQIAGGTGSCIETAQMR